MRQGPLAGRYPAAAAMVMFALIPYLALSAAIGPVTPIIGRDLHISPQAMSLGAGMANAAYAVGTVLAVWLAQLLHESRSGKSKIPGACDFAYEFSRLWENLHQSDPPITTTSRTKKTPMPNLRWDGGSVPTTGSVTVGEGAAILGEGEGVAVTGAGVSVAVAGGVTCSSSFCSGRMTEALLSPFHAIRSASDTAYQPAIHESVSPLWTV